MANNDLKNIISGSNIYFRTGITPETTTDVIIGLTEIEQAMEDHKFPNVSQNKHSPLDNKFPENTLVNVYISSYGGEDATTLAIINLFDMIKAKGSIIRTYNMSYASSNAGIIAISGSKGYRYMGSHAYNLIHFGKFTSTSASPYELEQSHTNMKHDIKEYKDLYLKNTNLSEEEIDSYFNHEGSGKLYARDCLAKGLCDYVITPRGWTNDVQDLIKQNIR